MGNMSHATSFREYLRELRRLNEPAPSSGHVVILPVGLTQHQNAPQAGAEELAALMRRDAAELVRRAASVYEGLSPGDRKAFLPRLHALHDRADRAYQAAHWVEFQAVLVEYRASLSQAQPDAPQPPLDKHWTYRAWSRVLDAEAWFVCCEQEVTQLLTTGVARGVIYTQAELVELLRLPQQPDAATLKSLHAVKHCFDATVVPVPDEGSPPPAQPREGVHPVSVSYPPHEA
jgi:hypothetical protein